jgi:4-alpha-glucanotransferase
MSQRTSGILLHPSSLCNAYPIGDLGPSAIAFVDFLVEAGQHWWQMLPIGPTGGGNSPYQSSSAFAGNPLLVSPERLIKQRYLSLQDITAPILSVSGSVNFIEAGQWKVSLLRNAFNNYLKQRHVGQQREFEAFKTAEAYWLQDYSLFMALQEREGTGDWTRWPPELRTRHTEALINAQDLLSSDIHYHEFIQWQFSLQWNELKDYCRAKGIRLIGDIPLFVAHHSADVWAHPELFKLNADGKSTVVAGVPPDYFSKTGQLWGLPVYRWEVLQAQHYCWWIERVRMSFSRFDINRLDHVIGFVQTYEVPAQETTALKGRYVLGGGVRLFRAIHEALGLMPFIADDLGDSTLCALRRNTSL